MDFINMVNMADVQPMEMSTTIILCAGVPFDDTYKHVRLFDSPQQLHSFVESKEIFRHETSAPVKRGYLNLSVNMDEYQLETANYVAFRSLPKAEQWTYGFITHIVPLNVNSCRVFFSLDVWTNNQFELKLNKCYIERQIIAKNKDVIGNFTLPEGLEYGEYVINEPQGNTIPEYHAPSLDEQYDEPMFVTTYDENGNVVDGVIRDGVYNCLEYFQPDNPQKYVRDMTESALIDGIVTVVMFPVEFLAEEAQWKILRIEKQYQSIDGYVPKNNKLFAYPYNFLFASNNMGSSAVYRYEFFGSEHGACEFEYTVNVSPEPSCVCVPRDYKRVPQNFNEIISFNGYAKCALSIDSYKAYLAQSGAYILANNLSGAEIPIPKSLEIAGIGRNLLAGNSNGFSGNLGDKTLELLPSQDSVDTAAFAINALLSGNPFSALKQSTQAYIQPPASRGALTSPVSALINRKCVSFMRMSITKEYARKIDNFFSMYGYLLGEIDVPDIKSRPSWNYVKTQNCALSGNIETNQLKMLRSIFDNGVTVWHTNDIGNYSLNN